MASKTASKTAPAALKGIDKDIDAVLGATTKTSTPRPGKKTSKGAGKKATKSAGKKAGKKAASRAPKKARGTTGDDLVDHANASQDTTVTSDDPAFLRKVGAPKNVIDRMVSLNKKNRGFYAVRTKGVWGVSHFSGKSAKGAGKKFKAEAKKVAGKVAKTAKAAGKKIKAEVKKATKKTKKGGATTNRGHKHNMLMRAFERKFHWWNTNAVEPSILTVGKSGPSIPFHPMQTQRMADTINQHARFAMGQAHTSIMERAKKTGAKGLDLIFAAAFLVYGEAQKIALEIADDDRMPETDYCMLAYMLSPHTADDILRDVGLSPTSYTTRLPEIHEAFRRLILSHLTKRMQSHFSLQIAFDLENSGDVSMEDAKAYVKHRESQSPNRIN